ncbi:hypothetical protein HMPREF2738_01439 [Clostridiales bacterium KLE1615]|nr:hypothetical protein HMPREF2738_01439 [Clostridiales bacterium KLE1615]
MIYWITPAYYFSNAGTILIVSSFLCTVKIYHSKREKTNCLPINCCL